MCRTKATMHTSHKSSRLSRSQTGAPLATNRISMVSTIIPFRTDFRSKGSSGSVCLGVEPVVHEGQGACRRLPERTQRRRQSHRQFDEAGVMLVARRVLHLIPPTLPPDCVPDCRVASAAGATAPAVADRRAGDGTPQTLAARIRADNKRLDRVTQQFNASPR